MADEALCYLRNLSCFQNNFPNLVSNTINLAFRHVNNMPKASPGPDPNQCRTRSKNAFAHPGRVIKEVLAVRRKPEEIEKEKKERNERQEAKAKKDAHKKAAIKDIAQFEHQMALDDKEQEARFPRHETEGEFKLTHSQQVIVMYSPSLNGLVEAQDKRCDQSAKAADATGPSKAQK